MLIELVFTNLPQQYSLPLSYKNTSVQVKWLSPTNSVTGAPPRYESTASNWLSSAPVFNCYATFCIPDRRPFTAYLPINL